MEDEAKKNLLLLFQNPLSPVFEPKGEEGNVSVYVQDEYLSERDRKLQDEAKFPAVYSAAAPEKFGSSTPAREVQVPRIVIPDKLNFPLSLGRKESFSVFIPEHRKMAAVLIEAYMEQPTVSDMFYLASSLHGRLNPQLAHYAQSVAALHRHDTKDIQLPSHSSLFPDKFMDTVALAYIKKEAKLRPDSRQPVVVEQIVTASELDDEYCLAYFREDLGVNLHHWHWHLVYPGEGPKAVIDRDRRGELFYYMHQQILARYNFERFSNGLEKAKALGDLRQHVPEGYFPKLNNEASSKIWPGRSSRTILTDVNRSDIKLKFQIEDLITWKERVLQAIYNKYVTTTKGETVSLDNEKGVDILGNIIEATDLSVNKNLYGDLHNKGHMAIAFSHDPDNRHLESFGVMGDSGTAMRDPIFYRWHTTVNKIFIEHKNLLTPYDKKQLGFDGVTITSAEVSVTGQSKNKLLTKWEQTDVNMAKGLDLNAKGEVLARFTHLAHEPFTYTIKVNNSGNERYGTCRICLAPKVDERGLPIPFLEQRDLFIEMDKFVVTLKKGVNEIKRSSKDASVVIPFETTFRSLKGLNMDDSSVDWFCGCGWPAHMLVPRGTKEGLACDLFVMISNYEDDKVEGCDPKTNTCKKNAASFCGLRDKKYPDKRAMGFPFDRLPSEGVSTLKGFLTPNMAVADVSIVNAENKFAQKKI